MKKYFVCLSALFLSLSANGQIRDTITYKFIDELRLKVKNETGRIIFAPSFTNKRIYINNNVFKEIPGLLYDGKIYKVKIQNGEWFVKKTGKWQLFYSPYKLAQPQLKIYVNCGVKYWWFNFKVVRTDMLWGYYCLIYEMYPIEMKRGRTIKGFNMAHSPRYWFCPTLGIIKIETGGETNYT